MNRTRLTRRDSAAGGNRTANRLLYMLRSGLFLGIAGGLLLGACGDDETNKAQAGVTGCTPKTSQCIAANLGVVCAEDGKTALSFSCSAGEKCENGACVGSCKAGEADCATEAVSRVCANDGKWIPVACSPGQACKEGKCVPNASSNQLCEPSSVTCATGTALKECDVAGASWIVTPCKSYEACSDGKCVVNEAAACTPGSAVCGNMTTLYRCNSTGTGYTKQTCPSTAPCSDGTCRGPVCNAGDSKCADVTYADWSPRNESASFDGPRRKELYTCVDGVRWEISGCSGSAQCVYDYLDPTEHARYATELKIWVGSGRREADFPGFRAPPGTSASCQTPECSLAQELAHAIGQPQTAPRVCGDPTDAYADATHSFSQCEGLAPFKARRWTNYHCPGSATCAPDGDGGGTCSSTCTPQQVRCNSGRTGSEQCDKDGNWKPKDACPSQKVCVDPALSNGVTCVEPACYHWFNVYEGAPPPTAGSCDTQGNLRPCLADGKLGTPAPCPNGVCVTVPNALQAGRCVSQCTEGQELCAGADSAQYKRCVSGRWVSNTCENNTTCFQYTESTEGGGTRVICGGTCEPGRRRCVSDGSIETCNSNGQWGAPAACDFGTCKESIDGAFCVGECVPEQISCDGDGAIGFRPCGANGRLLAAQPCPGGTKCRISATNKHLGCVECVGANSGGNLITLGIADSRCATTMSISYCGDDNKWSPAVACTEPKQCKQTAASGGSKAICQIE